MNTYLVRGYTKTGVYSEIIEDENMEDAFKKGKEKIKAMNPLSKITAWCIDREQ